MKMPDARTPDDRLLQRLRDALVQPVPPETAARHLAAMHEARPRARRWPALAAVAAAMMIGTASLALPGSPPSHGPADPDDPPRSPIAPATGGIRGGITDPSAVRSPRAANLGDLGPATAGGRSGEHRRDGEHRQGGEGRRDAEHRQDAEHRPDETPTGKEPGSGDGGAPDELPGSGTPPEDPGGGAGKPPGTPGHGPGGP